MSKKTFYTIIRVGTMSISLIILNLTYEIGIIGYILIGLVGLIWSITVDP